MVLCMLLHAGRNRGGGRDSLAGHRGTCGASRDGRAPAVQRPRESEPGGRRAYPGEARNNKVRMETGAARARGGSARDLAQAGVGPAGA